MPEACIVDAVRTRGGSARSARARSRFAALGAGCDPTVGGVTLDRFCGGGITAASLAAGQIRAGLEDLEVAGGSETTSVIARHQAQHQASGGRPGASNPRLQAGYPQSHQGMATDAIASPEGIDRAALDAFGAESQRRARRAIENGWRDRAIVPVVDDDGNVVLDRDEHPRPGTTAEALAGLRPSFRMIANGGAIALGHPTGAA